MCSSGCSDRTVFVRKHLRVIVYLFRTLGWWWRAKGKGECGRAVWLGRKEAGKWGAGEPVADGGVVHPLQLGPSWGAMCLPGWRGHEDPQPGFSSWAPGVLFLCHFSTLLYKDRTGAAVILPRSQDGGKVWFIVGTCWFALLLPFSHPSHSDASTPFWKGCQVQQWMQNLFFATDNPTVIQRFWGQRRKRGQQVSLCQLSVGVPPKGG